MRLKTLIPIIILNLCFVPSSFALYPVRYFAGSSERQSGDIIRASNGVYGHITRDTTWSDTVLVTGDVVVDSGVRLTISAGTKITFAIPSLWDYDSSYLKRCDIYCENGNLQALGNPADRIFMAGIHNDPGCWGGIKLKKGGLNRLEFTKIADADTAVFCDSAIVEMNESVIENCGNGIIGINNVILKIANCIFTDISSWGCNAYGVFADSAEEVSIISSVISECSAETVPELIGYYLGEAWGINVEAKKIVIQGDTIMKCSGGVGGRGIGAICAGDSIIFEANKICYCTGGDGGVTGTSSWPILGGCAVGVELNGVFLKIITNTVDSIIGGEAGADLVAPGYGRGGNASGMIVSGDSAILESNVISNCRGGAGGWYQYTGDGIGLTLDAAGADLMSNRFFHCNRGECRDSSSHPGKGIGVSVKGKCTIGGSAEAQNDLFDNSDYNIVNYSPDDIIATYNWWGSTNRDTIEKYIFDKADSSALGRVIYEPWADKPLLISEREKVKSEKMMFSVFPNPFSRVVKISSENPVTRSEGNTIKIYDIAGRVVKSFTLTPGSSLLATGISWDGRDDTGKMLPAGVYFCELKAGMTQSTKKLVLLR